MKVLKKKLLILFAFGLLITSIGIKSYSMLSIYQNIVVGAEQSALPIAPISNVFLKF